MPEAKKRSRAAKFQKYITRNFKRLTPSKRVAECEKLLESRDGIWKALNELKTRNVPADMVEIGQREYYKPGELFLLEEKQQISTYDKM